MKTLVSASLLFIAVLSVIAFNYFYLHDLLDYTEETLDKIPETIEEIESLSVYEKTKISLSMEKLNKKWKNKESFLCMCLRHEVSRDFTEEMILAKAFFDSGSYADFIANIMTAKDTVAHIKYDEELKVGNLL